TQHDNNLQTQHDNNLQTQRDNDLQTQRDNDSHAQYDSNLHLQHVDDTCHSEGAKATEESIIFTENQDATNAQGYIYIVTNKNKTTLYIGVTSNLIKRIYEHKNHVVEGFSDKYNCEYLVYFECFLNIKEAIEREKYLKGKKREFKENLINSINPGWIDLYDYICQRDVSATPQHDNNMQMQHDNNSHLKHDNTLYFGQTNCHSGQTNCHSGQTSCHSEQSEESILKYISVHSLKDMIDFSRTTFDKAIKTSVQAAAVQIESKFPMVKIKDICEIGRGKVMDKQFMESHKGIYPVYSSQTSNNGIMGSIDTYMFDGEYVTWTTDGIYAGTCFYRNGKFNCTNVCGTLKLKADKKDIAVAKFLPEVLNMVTPNYVVRVANPKLMNNVMAEVQITLPPLDVQTSIVAECEQIDAEYQNAQKEIADANKKISEIMETSLKNASDVYKLSNKDIFDVSIGRRILSTEINDNYDVPVYSANVFEPFGKINKLLIKDFSVPSVLWGIDGDWQVNVIAENQPFYPTDHCGVLRIKNNQLEPKFVAYTLEKAGQKEGFKRSYRASIDRIEGMNIKLPPLAEQQKIVAQITALEEKITAAKRTMTECPEKKQAVLDKWLK
ncbi:MAG: restriction endonuclease subunit S, partial [Treponema sp.]